MKKIVFVLLVLILLMYLNQKGVFSVLRLVNQKTISSSVEDFKTMCTETKGDYIDSISFGIGPVRNISCGYYKAPDAGRLCKSEKSVVNTCGLCFYGPGCGLTAGDFGPEQCRCLKYGKTKVLSGKDIPKITNEQLQELKQNN